MEMEIGGVTATKAVAEKLWSAVAVAVMVIEVPAIDWLWPVPGTVTV
jgi:hypothetical protein